MFLLIGCVMHCCMVEYKTIRVPESDYEQAKALKEEHDRTWGEQLIATGSETADSAGEPTDAVAEEFDMTLDGVTPEDIAEEIDALMQQFESHDATMENGIDTIISKIDGLSVTLDASERKQLARDIAEELR